MLKILRKINWEEWGSKRNNKGNIVRVSVPFPLWVLDLWFESVHNWWGKIPGWDKFWGKVNSNWGDPFCAAYCFPWTNFYWNHRVEEHSVEVGYDNLSKEFKESYERSFEEF